MMPHELGWKGSLICGLSPVSWQREVARIAICLDDLRRASAWIESNDPVEELMQSQEPLMGSTLAWLVEAWKSEGISQCIPRSKGKIEDLAQRDSIRSPGKRESLSWQHRPAPRAMQAGRDYDKASNRGPEIENESLSGGALTKFSESSNRLDKSNLQLFFPYHESSGKTERSMPLTGHRSKRTSGEKPPLLGLKKQVDKAILSRLAGEILMAVDQPLHRPILRMPTRRGQKLTLPTRDQRSSRGWLDGPSRGVIRSFRSFWPELFHHQIPEDLSEEHFPIKSNFNEPLSLMDQWSLPLHGMTAPMSLLDSLCEGDEASLGKSRRPDNAGNSRRETSAKSPGGLKAASPGRTQQIQVSKTRPANDAENCFWPVMTRQFSTAPSLEPSDHYRSDHHLVAPNRSTNADNRLGASSTAAFLKIETLRETRLLGGEVATSPSTSGVSSEHVLHGIERESKLTDEEDLNVLATKIKRILDEEARRHGIGI